MKEQKESKAAEAPSVDAVIAEAINPANLVKVLNRYVLVKQMMKKKKTAIILDGANSNEDKFDYSFEIVQKGDKCESDINVGDHPIFEQHVNFNGLKLVEKGEWGMISLVIVHEESIIGIDLDPKKI